LARAITQYSSLFANASVEILTLISRDLGQRHTDRARSIGCRPSRRLRRSRPMSIRLDHGDGALDVVHEINVTPFIDVVLVLLIVFMIVAPLANVDIPVDLPTANAEHQPRPDESIFLTVKADLTLALNDETVTPATLPSALNAATNGDHTQRIFLRADKTVPYGNLMDAMNALRAANYLKVALVGLEPETTP
jgi:biopolymer transport protein ExbD